MTAEQRTVLENNRTARGYELLPNGLLVIRDEWGWLYIKPDGTKHSRMYR